LFAEAGACLFFFATAAFSQSVLVNDAGDATHACAVSGTGQCTLRDAILYANTTSGTTIVFNIPGAGVHTIRPATDLPAIVNPTTIDGYTQPGASANSNPTGIGRTNAVILIELDGSFESGGATGIGLAITGGGSLVRGLVIGGWATAGIVLQTTGNNRVQGNFIGTNPAGTAGHGNLVGIHVIDGSRDIVGGQAQLLSSIGFPTNLISGNGTGVLIEAQGTTVQQNIVGLDAAGDAAVSNIVGISIFGADAVVGTVPGMPISPNYFSGNATLGILVQPGGANCQLVGNIVGGAGLGVSGTLGNGSAGVQNNSAPGVTITRNTIIGNTGPGIEVLDATGTMIGVGGFPNTISGNGGAGVLIEGTSLNSTISQNSIFANGGLGIDLGNDGVTPNDPCDADTGPNNLQNSPVLTSATSVGGSTTIQGTLNSTASTAYTIEFFTNDVCDPSGNGQGKTFIGSTTVSTDPSCNATIDVTFPFVTRGIITATATDPNGNTSEFSACRPISAQFHTTTPCRLIDTRGPTGAWGAPSLMAGADRTFVVGGKCGVPVTALAVVFNFTITNPTAAGDLRAFAAGSTMPLVSTMNWSAGQTRANNAVVTLGPAGDMTIHVDQSGGTVDFIADISGYFE
jgi:CSLREA domain-containing protein